MSTRTPTPKKNLRNELEAVADTRASKNNTPNNSVDRGPDSESKDAVSPSYGHIFPGTAPYGNMGTDYLWSPPTKSSKLSVVHEKIMVAFKNRLLQLPDTAPLAKRLFLSMSDIKKAIMDNKRDLVTEELTYSELLTIYNKLLAHYVDEKKYAHALVLLTGLRCTAQGPHVQFNLYCPSDDEVCILCPKAEKERGKSEGSPLIEPEALPAETGGEQKQEEDEEEEEVSEEPPVPQQEEKPEEEEGADAVNRKKNVKPLKNSEAGERTIQSKEPEASCRRIPKIWDLDDATIQTILLQGYMELFGKEGSNPTKVKTTVCEVGQRLIIKLESYFKLESEPKTVRYVLGTLHLYHAYFKAYDFYMGRTPHNYNDPIFGFFGTANGALGHVRSSRTWVNYILPLSDKKTLETEPAPRELTPHFEKVYSSPRQWKAPKTPTTTTSPTTSPTTITITTPTIITITTPTTITITPTATATAKMTPTTLKKPPKKA